MNTMTDTPGSPSRAPARCICSLVQASRAGTSRASGVTRRAEHSAVVVRDEHRGDAAFRVREQNGDRQHEEYDRGVQRHWDVRVETVELVHIERVAEHGQQRDISVSMANSDGWAVKDVPFRFQWTFPTLRRRTTRARCM